MTLMLDLVLLAAGLVLLQRSTFEGDDVWSLFLRSLAVIDLVIITIGHGLLWVEMPLLVLLPLLVLALALPSVAQLEQRGR